MLDQRSFSHSGSRLCRLESRDNRLRRMTFAPSAKAFEISPMSNRQNIAIETRWAEGHHDRLKPLAPELVQLKIAVIVTHSDAAGRAVKEVTRDPRGQLLRAAVGFSGCSMPLCDRALWALRAWLSSWPGIGHVVVGMHRQGYDLQLTQYGRRVGTAPRHTTQRATWEALKKAASDS